MILKSHGLDKLESNSYNPEEKKDFALAGTISTHTTSVYLNVSM